MTRSSDWFEHDASGRRGIGFLSCGCQAPAGGVDAEHHKVTRILIGGDQKATRRINSEVARRPAFGGNVLDGFQRPLEGVDGKYRYAVGAAIGAVEKFVRWANRHFRASAGTLEITG